MPTEGDFLQAIRAEPNDLELRQVFADWLEDQGDPRGEHLRLATELEMLPVPHPLREGLYQKMKAIEDQHKAQWLGPWHSIQANFSFHSGVWAYNDLFPRENRIKEGEDHSRGWLMEMILPDCTDPELEEIAQNPFLRHFSWYYLIEGNITVHGLWELLTSVHLGTISSLIADENELGEAGANWIAECPSSSSLRTLEIGWNEIGSKGAIALAQSKHLEKLQRLKLADNEIGPTGAQALGQSKVLNNLEELDLSYNNNMARGLVSFFRGTGLPKLKTLILEDISMTDKQAEILAESPMLSHIRHLNLRANDISSQGAQALLRAPNLNNLHSLDIRGNKLKDSHKEQFQAVLGDRLK